MPSVLMMMLMMMLVMMFVVLMTTGFTMMMCHIFTVLLISRCKDTAHPLQLSCKVAILRKVRRGKYRKRDSRPPRHAPLSPQGR